MFSLEDEPNPLDWKRTKYVIVMNAHADYLIINTHISVQETTHLHKYVITSIDICSACKSECRVNILPVTEYINLKSTSRESVFLVPLVLAFAGIDTDARTKIDRALFILLIIKVD